jgi:hypothetical protein
MDAVGPSLAARAGALQANTGGAALPADAPVHSSVEAFLIGADDEREALRGQVRAFAGGFGSKLVRRACSAR